MISVAAFENICIIGHTVTNILGLTANGLVIYLTLFHTPTNFKSYSVLIFNAGLFDLIACFSAVFVQTRIIPTGMSLMMVPSGPCRLIGKRFCYSLHSLTVSCYTQSMWGLFISFFYRYLILIGWNISKKKLVILLAIIYIPSFLQLIVLPLSYDDQTALVAIYHKRFPEYAIDEGFLMGSVSILEWKMLFSVVHVCVPVFPIYASIFFCRRRIVNILSNNAEMMTDSTRRMHKNLLYVMTYQASLPFLYGFTMVVFFLAVFQIYSHPFLEYSVFLILGLVPVLSPLGFLYFISPYNRWLKGKLTKRRIEITNSYVISQ